VPRQIRVGESTLLVPRELEPVLAASRGISSIETHTVQFDLTRPDDSAKLGDGGYDIITEHFLTALLYKDMEQVGATRATYGKLLRPGGCLMAATGHFSESREELPRIYARHQLRLDAGSVLETWDPYDLPRADLNKLHHGLAVRLENTLACYVRE
jgi:hypothetical protein